MSHTSATKWTPSCLIETELTVRMGSGASLDSMELVEDNILQRGCCNGEPISEAGKRRQIARMMSLLLVPVLALLALSSYFVVETVMINTYNENTRSIIHFSISLGEVLKMLQLERDESVLYLSDIGPTTKIFLLKQYLETDVYIDQLSMWPGDLQDSLNENFRSRKAFQRHLTAHRNSIELYNNTVFDEINFYNELITIFHKWLYRTLEESRYNTMWKTLVAYQKIIFARLDVGVERALGVFFFSGGFADHTTYMLYNKEVNVFQHTFRTTQNFSKLVKPIETYDAPTISGRNLTAIINDYRHRIQYHNIIHRSRKEARYWFDNMTTFIDILFDIQTELADDILLMVNDKQSSTVGRFGMSVFLVIIAVCMMPILTQAVHRTTTDIQSFAIILADKTKELAHEKAKTNAILNQMLPRQVARQLKQGVAVKARYYKEVTVVFIEIVGFTSMTTKFSPLDLIGLVNDLYRLFDSRIDLFDVYKVETIGHSYIVASGLPTTNGHRHASAIANLSLDLLAASSDIHIDLLGGESVRLRIGIHSGPVVAGVIGSKLPRYCLFGDTVNTASRMKTMGLPSRIHISTKTYRLLLAHGWYEMDERGSVEIKGKGPTTTYWLNGRTSADEHNEGALGKGIECLSTRQDSHCDDKVPIVSSQSSFFRSPDEFTTPINW